MALIAVNTSFNPAALAGEQTSRLPGRPGINGLQLDSYVELPQEDINVIQRIAKQTNINVEKEITRKEGYFPELASDEAELGALKFKLGKTHKFVNKLNETDMARIGNAIHEAQLQADYIMISVHSHQLSGDAKDNPADFSKNLPTAASIWVPMPLWDTVLICCGPSRCTRIAPAQQRPGDRTILSRYVPALRYPGAAGNGRNTYGYLVKIIRQRVTSAVFSGIKIKFYIILTHIICTVLMVKVIV